MSHSKELTEPADLIVTLRDLIGGIGVRLGDGLLKLLNTLLAGLELLLKDHDRLPQGLRRDLLRNT
jgi:hypothetical protein